MLIDAFYEVVHKDDSYPGEHCEHRPRDLGRGSCDPTAKSALLKGLLFGPDSAAFSPTHTRKGDKLYRYYVSQTVQGHGAGACPVGRVPAGEIEAHVIDQLHTVFHQPEIVAGTWKAARAHADDVTEADARAALQQLDPLWDGG